MKIPWEFTSDYRLSMVEIPWTQVLFFLDEKKKGSGGNEDQNNLPHPRRPVTVSHDFNRQMSRNMLKKIDEKQLRDLREDFV
jgi:hypothetical protein